MKSCLFLVSILLSSLTVIGQENNMPINILKAYPLSAIKNEFRLGLERETEPGRSIEYGIGYLYRVFERNDCKECYFLLPLYYSPYTGNGGVIRVNFNTYKNKENGLKDAYSSIGLKYQFMNLDTPNGYPSGPAIPYGYAITKQHSLSLQGLFGKKFSLQHLVTDVYAGLNVQADMNSYAILRPEYNSKDPALHLGIGVNLGVSFGYMYGRKADYYKKD